MQPANGKLYSSEGFLEFEGQIVNRAAYHGRFYSPNGELVYEGFYKDYKPETRELGYYDAFMFLSWWQLGLALGFGLLGGALLYLCYFFTLDGGSVDELRGILSGEGDVGEDSNLDGEGSGSEEVLRVQEPYLSKRERRRLAAVKRQEGAIKVEEALVKVVSKDEKEFGEFSARVNSSGNLHSINMYKSRFENIGSFSGLFDIGDVSLEKKYAKESRRLKEKFDSLSKDLEEVFELLLGLKDRDYDESDLKLIRKFSGYNGGFLGYLGETIDELELLASSIRALATRVKNQAVELSVASDSIVAPLDDDGLNTLKRSVGQFSLSKRKELLNRQRNLEKVLGDAFDLDVSGFDMSRLEIDSLLDKRDAIAGLIRGLKGTLKGKGFLGSLDLHRASFEDLVQRRDDLVARILEFDVAFGEFSSLVKLAASKREVEARSRLAQKARVLAVGASNRPVIFASRASVEVGNSGDFLATFCREYQEACRDRGEFSLGEASNRVYLFYGLLYAQMRHHHFQDRDVRNALRHSFLRLDPSEEAAILQLGEMVRDVPDVSVLVSSERMSLQDILEALFMDLHLLGELVRKRGLSLSLYGNVVCAIKGIIGCIAEHLNAFKREKSSAEFDRFISSLPPVFKVKDLITGNATTIFQEYSRRIGHSFESDMAGVVAAEVPEAVCGRMLGYSKRQVGLLLSAMDGEGSKVLRYRRHSKNAK